MTSEQILIYCVIPSICSGIISSFVTLFVFLLVSSREVKKEYWNYRSKLNDGQNMTFPEYRVETSHQFVPNAEKIAPKAFTEEELWEKQQKR